MVHPASRTLKTPHVQPCGAFLRFALFLFLFFGCATGRVAIPDAPPFNSPAELIQILTARQIHLKDQRVRARISLRIDGVSERRATALLQYRTPGDLKIDIGTLGVSILSASGANDTLRVFLPRDNQYLQGAPARVLETLTGVNMSYYDIHHAIFGLPNLSEPDILRVTRYVPGERVLIELRHPRWTRRLWLDQRTATLLEEHVFAPNGQRLSKRLLSGYRVESGFILPGRIEIHQGEDFIQIDVQSRAINAGLSDADFVLRIPGDVTRHEIK